MAGVARRAAPRPRPRFRLAGRPAPPERGNLGSRRPRGSRPPGSPRAPAAARPGARGLLPRLLLRLLAEREPDPVEIGRSEPREHVRLVLARVARAGQQQPPAMLEPCGHSGPSRGALRPRGARTRAARRSGSCRCSECRDSASPRRRSRRRTVSTTAERNSWRRSSVTCGSPSRWQVSRAASTACGRAAGAFGIRSGRVEPEPQRHADRVTAGAEKRDGAVHAAAHRDGHALGRPRRAEDRTDRVRECVDGERLTSDRRRLEQRQPLRAERRARPRPHRRCCSPSSRRRTHAQSPFRDESSENLDHAGENSHVDPSEWDWTPDRRRPSWRSHASDYAESVRFYEAVLAPLGIPRIAMTDEERRSPPAFANFDVVDRKPPTAKLHLCFHARSREQVDEFHAAGVGAGLPLERRPRLSRLRPGLLRRLPARPGREQHRSAVPRRRQPRPRRRDVVTATFPTKGA